MEHLREEREQIRQLRNNLESRLKVILPDDIGAALMDGVVLCHLANHIRPRSVASIHVPSPAVPKLSMAKCRRNVENFLDACKKLGVPQLGKSESSLIHALLYFTGKTLLASSHSGGKRPCKSCQAACHLICWIALELFSFLHGNIQAIKN
uniref:Calponin-homology (CH) domain-containing protein n=1 Tax=Anas platyrhynchos platyrhynchos TaxID=8840 RepID=A0A493SYG9_ANAPP